MNTNLVSAICFSVRIVERFLFVLYYKMSFRLLLHQIFTITLLNGCHVMNNSMFDATHATMTIIASCLHDNNDMFTQGPRGGMFEDSWLLQLLNFRLSTSHMNDHIGLTRSSTHMVEADFTFHHLQQNIFFLPCRKKTTIYWLCNNT